MKNRLWVFPAITCLILAILYLGQHWYLALLALGLWLLRILRLQNQRLVKVTCLISLLFSGVFLLHQHTNKTSLSGDENRLLVTPEPASIKIDGDYFRFMGRALIQQGQKNKSEKIEVCYYLKSIEEKEKWQTDGLPAHLLLTGTIEKPAEPSNFYQFNYRNYLRQQRIYWQFNADSVEAVTAIPLKEPYFYKIEKARAAIIHYIDQTFHQKIAQYMKTVLFADRREFSEETMGNYRSLGVIHLFSISGFHIAYLAKWIKRFLLRIGMTHERSDLLLICALPLYGLLAGFGVSVFRAVTQKTTKIASRLLDQELNTLDAWALALMVALMINPYYVYNLSFQLSYTLSGIFILVRSREWLQKLQPIVKTFIYSLISMVASIPILTYHFFEISWVTSFANMLFIPLFTYFLFPSLIFLLLLSLIASNLHIFVFLNELFVFFISEIENLLSLLTKHFDFTIVTGRLPAFVFFLLIICIVKMIKDIEQKQLPAMVLVVSIIGCLFWYRISPVSYVAMLDVGQGDAFLVRDAIERKVTLIDTGGRPDWQKKKEWQKRESPFSIGEDIVVPALKSFGITAIDRLYLTHADVDHVGELYEIYEGVTVKELATTKAAFKDPMLLKTISQLEDPQLVAINPLETLPFPNTQTIALHPTGPAKNKNNQSLVLYVKLGEDYWLFTGDIEAEVEKKLIHQYPKLTVDYLKLAHHGSRSSTSNEFIRALKPEAAFISAGVDNTFGHPSQEVLERLAEHEVDIYSTSEVGAVKVNYIKIPFKDRWLSNIQTVK